MQAMRKIGRLRPLTLVAACGAAASCLAQAPAPTPAPAPSAAPAAPDEASMSTARVLELVNQQRGQARRCGERTFEAARPLRPSELLDAAARAHVQDMAAKDFFDLKGSDGSSTADRAVRAGYRWSGMGENLGSGPYSAERVVEGWLADPVQCANIMHPAFVDVGLARAPGSGGRPGWYLWSMVVGRPR